MDFKAGDTIYAQKTYVDAVGNAIVFDSGTNFYGYLRRNGVLQDGTGSTSDTHTAAAAISSVTGGWQFSLAVPSGWTNGTDIVQAVCRYTLNGNLYEDTLGPPFKLDGPVAISGNVTVGGYATGEDPATLLLVTPANKLATNASGNVTVNGNVTVGGYATGEDPASLLAAAGYTATRAGYLDDITAIKAQTDKLPAVPAAQSDVLGVWTTAMGEAYAANGAAMTPAEALYMIYSVCAQFAVGGTSIVAKKLDGATTALTFTIDSADAPTERTRSA